MSPYASPNDHRRYHYLELANRLRVLLICDPETDKSAASLAVNTGHFDDPADRQGMAHFLEHMLFLGTRTYPKPGEYQQFMSRHGGSNNAWTGTEFTNFFFDIDNGFFEAGLDRFSQFFICPTFAPEWVDKERNAVDSEYRLKLQDDVRRSYQVHKETVNPDHPFSKFSVGNLDTLADLPGRDLRSDLIAFYETHYSADRMALVMLSPAPIETQLAWCDRFFGAIPDRRLGPPVLSHPLYRLDDLGIRIQLTPVKETRKLALTFPLPCVDEYYDKKPLTFLSHLIGYEGEGSLLSLLKGRGWVNQLAAGGGISGANFKDFGVSFGLTPLGLEHVDEIIAALFGYLKLIERGGVQAWRYEEKRSVLESAFRFQERGRALDTVSGLVLNLFSYGPDDLLYGDYMMREFDEPLIRRFLAKLTPHNLRVTIQAPEGRRPTPSSAPASTPVCRRCPPTCRPASSTGPVSGSGTCMSISSACPRAAFISPSTANMRSRARVTSPWRVWPWNCSRITSTPSPTRRSSRALATRFMPIRGALPSTSAALPTSNRCCST